MAVMAVMRDEGKIRTIALSCMILEVPPGAVQLAIGCVQDALSVVAHNAEDVPQLSGDGIA